MNNTSNLRKNIVQFTIDNCMDCPQHKSADDPDPSDWFEDDDCKVICEKVKRNITVGCRPYHCRQECDIPDWCPLLHK